MKCISVRQPWAWAIVHAGKDIENRTWATSYRGPILIHAGKAKPSREDCEFARRFLKARGIALPDIDSQEYGKVIGVGELIGCGEVNRPRSRWWHGPVGWRILTRRPTASPWRASRRMEFLCKRWPQTKGYSVFRLRYFGLVACSLPSQPREARIS